MKIGGWCESRWKEFVSLGVFLAVALGCSAAWAAPQDAGSIPLWWWISPLGGIVACVFAAVFYYEMKGAAPGTPAMERIAGFVREGAYAYLKQQYKVVAVVFVILSLFFAFLAFVLKVQSQWVPFSFLTGGFFSGLCGYLGMKTATFAGSKTAQAARTSLNGALRIAFRSGAVMGLVVVGLGLLDISIWFYVLYRLVGVGLVETTVTMLCFGMGASTQALFARVGGGIFTKAADVGADLVGKVEAGIPEDDPRNPAVIADNVGDNVGDVAGMGADLYESYCGSILATAALGAAAFAGTGLDMSSVVLPMVIAGIGCALSVLGVYFVRTGEKASKRELLSALGKGVNGSSIAILAASAACVYFIVPGHFGLWGSIASGLIAGVIIGKSTEYFTADEYAPTKEVANHSLTGPATVIISGISVGMLSTWIPVVVVGISILLSFGFAGGFHNVALGLYGVGISAVGMLSTLGITLATDAYGPIADNAGGNAQMSGLEASVRERTDALDSLGNTTAATGKGFAIGSAALTALALLASYIEEIRTAMIRVGQDVIQIGDQSVDVAKATLDQFMLYYNVTLMNPKLLVGMFLGSMMAFLFCSLAIRAVGRAAGRMVEEVRRQFKDIPGIMEGTGQPDYAACVNISTRGAQRAMILPSSLAIVIPIATGLLLDVSGVMGLLAGALATGFVLAIMMANAGGAWDNAKKHVEKGNLGGKHSPAHKASVVGDTVGDPFKDTAGPALNILIKLMSMVTIVVAGVTVQYAPLIARFLRM